jgi:hypothetical protein
MQKIFVLPSERAEAIADFIAMRDLLGQLDIPITKTGWDAGTRSGRSPCPFHEGSNATDFSWTGEGFWHCSSCKRHGNKIGLIRARKKISSDRKLLEFVTMLATRVSPFTRFGLYCGKDQETNRLLTRLLNMGCNARLIFDWLRVYIENPPESVALRRADGHRIRSRIRLHMRAGQLAVGQDKGLMARTHAAFDLKRLGVEHLTPLLFSVRYYVEMKTGRRPAVNDLALLLEAVWAALMRSPINVSRDAVRKELSRFEKRNPYMVDLSKSTVMARIAGIQWPEAGQFLPVVNRDVRTWPSSSPAESYGIVKPRQDRVASQFDSRVS